MHCTCRHRSSRCGDPCYRESAPAPCAPGCTRASAPAGCKNMACMARGQSSSRASVRNGWVAAPAAPPWQITPYHVRVCVRVQFVQVMAVLAPDGGGMISTAKFREVGVVASALLVTPPPHLPVLCFCLQRVLYTAWPSLPWRSVKRRRAKGLLCAGVARRPRADRMFPHGPPACRMCPCAGA